MSDRPKICLKKHHKKTFLQELNRYHYLRTCIVKGCVHIHVCLAHKNKNNSKYFLNIHDVRCHMLTEAKHHMKYSSACIHKKHLARMLGVKLSN